MKTNKKFFTTKKKLMLLGACLFTSGLAVSITSTYAWYSLIEAGYISGLNLTLNSDFTLELYRKDEEGNIVVNEQELDKDDFDYDEDDKFYLSQVSGMFEERTWRDDEFDYSTDLPRFADAYGTSSKYAGNYKYTKVVEPDEEGNLPYLQYVLYIKSNRDCSVFFTEESKFVPDVRANEIVAREKGRDVESLNAVKDAVRVSFLSDDGNYVIVRAPELDNDGEEFAKTKYGGLIDLDNDGYYDYDATTKKEIVYGQYDDTEISYLAPLSEEEAAREYDESLVSDESTFTANHKAGVERVDLTSIDIVEENCYPIDKLMYSEEKIGQRIDPLLTLRANEEKRLVVTTYLEGWDLHTTDAIELASMRIDLYLTALEGYGYGFF